jgi:hypothetical protein
MAFEGDCGTSTVLEALRVAHAARFLVLVTSRGPRDEALRNSATPTVGSRRRMRAGGRQIRNPKSEIRSPLRWAEFLIPNS